MKNMTRIFTASLATVVLCACQKQDNLVSLQVSSLASPPQTVNIQINNYKPQTGNAYANLFVSNFSVQVNQGTLSLSTPRDGMADTLKQSIVNQYGFSIYSPESVVPGFQDLMLYDSGIDLSQQELMYCSPDDMGSVANDILTYNDTRYAGSPLTTLGLRDCDKLYMGLKNLSFDSNENGIPDYFELRCGMNPLDKNEAFVSTAGDGVANIDKCKMNIPLDESASTEANQLFAYQYSNTVNSDGSLNFNINNIPVLNAGQDNFIAFYVVETNLQTNTSSLYTAFLILPAGYVGDTIQIDYWAISASTLTNQQIQLPAAN